MSISDEDDDKIGSYIHLTLFIESVVRIKFIRRLLTSWIRYTRERPTVHQKRMTRCRVEVLHFIARLRRRS